MSKELADRVVALGVGEYIDGLYWLQTDDMDAFGDPQVRNNWLKKDAVGFTSDWRVAGALMEKLVVSGRYVDIFNCWKHYGDPKKESLPTAIIQACVDALEAK